MKALPRRLRILRAERGWSQIQTAQRSGMKEYRYSRIELGYSEPTDDEIEQLARTFGVEPESIRPAGELAGRAS